MPGRSFPGHCNIYIPLYVFHQTATMKLYVIVPAIAALILCSCRKNKPEITTPTPAPAINSRYDTFSGILHHRYYVVQEFEGVRTDTSFDLTSYVVVYNGDDSITIYDNFDNTDWVFTDSGVDHAVHASGIFSFNYHKNDSNVYTLEKPGYRIEIKGDSLYYHYAYDPFYLHLKGGYTTHLIGTFAGKNKGLPSKPL